MRLRALPENMVEGYSMASCTMPQSSRSNAQLCAGAAWTRNAYGTSPERVGACRPRVPELPFALTQDEVVEPPAKPSNNNMVFKGLEGPERADSSCKSDNSSRARRRGCAHLGLPADPPEGGRRSLQQPSRRLVRDASALSVDHVLCYGRIPGWGRRSPCRRPG